MCVFWERTHIYTIASSGCHCARASHTFSTMLQMAFCSLGPHCFLLQDSSLCLVGTAPIWLWFSWCSTACSMPVHLVTLWKGHSMPLSDLGRETTCHLRRSFIFLKRILKQMLSQHPLFWIHTSAVLSMNTSQFTVCNCKLLPKIVCFSNFAFQLFKISVVEKNFNSQHRPLRPVLGIRPNIQNK